MGRERWKREHILPRFPFHCYTNPYIMEFFAWRDFQTPKQVGALAGLTPTPYQSGQSRRELGIAKAGNRHIRAMAIEIAWAWRRFQPDRALSQWYKRRFGAGSARLRKLGIGGPCPQAV